MSDQGEYWEDAIGDAFEQVGIFDAWGSLPAEKRTAIGLSMERAAEGLSMAFHVPESPGAGEIARLEQSLRVERSKVGCRHCGGSGRLSYSSGPWAVNTQCDACNGEGKVVQ